jgi:hypothetical protein
VVFPDLLELVGNIVLWATINTCLLLWEGKK